MAIIYSFPKTTDIYSGDNFIITRYDSEEKVFRNYSVTAATLSNFFTKGEPSDVTNGTVPVASETGFVDSPIIVSNNNIQVTGNTNLGTATATTEDDASNSTNIATTEFVKNVALQGDIGIGENGYHGIPMGSSSSATPKVLQNSNIKQGSLGTVVVGFDVGGGAFPGEDLALDIGGPTRTRKSLELRSPNNQTLNTLTFRTNTNDPDFQITASQNGNTIINSGNNVIIETGTSEVAEISSTGLALKNSATLSVPGNAVFDSSVAIGAESPDYKLHVVGTIRGAQLRSNDNGTGNTANSSILLTNNDVEKGGIRFLHNFNSGVGEMRIKSSSDLKLQTTNNGTVNTVITIDQQQKVKVAKGIQFPNWNEAASADNVGTIRYNSSGSSNALQVCLRTGATTYAWVDLARSGF